MLTFHAQERLPGLDGLGPETVFAGEDRQDSVTKHDVVTVTERGRTKESLSKMLSEGQVWWHIPASLGGKKQKDQVETGQHLPHD